MRGTHIFYRKSKIIATIGPASSHEDTILELIQNGVDAFRLNFSHSTPETHLCILRRIRQIEERTGRIIPVIQDLPGPKIRIGRLPNDELELRKGDIIYFSSSPSQSDKIISVNFPDFEKEIKPGERIYMGDGEIELEVMEIGTTVKATVRRGGTLRSGKGITFPVSFYMPSLTSRDREYLKIGVENGFDYIALSYVQRPEDVYEAKELIREIGGTSGVIAKIERCEALEHLEDITRIADGLIVARGDLGVVLSIVKIPHEQHRIVRTARRYGKPVFVATQMLSSMIEHNRPTRAEVTDVTQSVGDGADGVLLSEETAIGRFPKETVKWANKILSEAEYNLSPPKIVPRKDDVNEVISYHAVEITKWLRVKCIVTPTYSGTTPIRISKFRPNVPIIAFVPSIRMGRKLNLFYGVQSVVHKVSTFKHMEERAYQMVISGDTIRDEDYVMFLWGHPFESKGITNTIAIKRVSELQTETRGD